MIKSFRCVIDLEMQDGSKHQFSSSSGQVTKMGELSGLVSARVQDAIDRLAAEFTADASRALADEQKAHAVTKDAHTKVVAEHAALKAATAVSAKSFQDEAIIPGKVEVATQTDKTEDQPRSRKSRR